MESESQDLEKRLRELPGTAEEIMGKKFGFRDGLLMLLVPGGAIYNPWKLYQGIQKTLMLQ